MGTGFERLRRNKRFLALAVGVGLLVGFFTPIIPQASAFTIDLGFPDNDDSTIVQSAAGARFEIVIDVESGEFISVHEVALILDNNLASAKGLYFFESDVWVEEDGVIPLGEGDDSVIVNNELEVDLVGEADYSYNYGYGYVVDDFDFIPPYYYVIEGINDVVGTNDPGPCDFPRPGLVGPGEIIISGVLRTANMEPGEHTLDAIINHESSCGFNLENSLLANTLEFTLEAGDLVVDETEVDVGSTEAEIETTDSDGNSITVNLFFGAPTGSTGNVVVVVQSVDDFIAANTEEELEEQGFELDGDDLIFTTGSDAFKFIAVGFIMDIDISALGLPDGTEVTLSMNYDDSGLSDSQENRVRLMHQLDIGDEWEALTNDDESINDGDEVDTDANIVYGTTDDFSLFGPAVRESVDTGDDDDDEAGGGGGGSRSIVITWPTAPTFDAEHFVNFPLQRMLVANSAFVNAAGVSIDAAQTGQQVSISGSFTNQQKTAQDYAFIVQVEDETGFVTDISWQQGILQSGSTAEVSTLWTPETDGDYTVKIFVWDGISTAPTPLSQVTVKNIQVA